MKKILLFSILLVLAGCDSCRCHSKHMSVTYNEAYTSIEEICSGVPPHETCFSYPMYHPASCSTWWSCDERCADKDKGKFEAHPKHETLINGPAIDPRCNANGTVK